jgi:Quinohemoprotein amine dehydrogenase, alpha subunit domain III
MRSAHLTTWILLLAGLLSATHPTVTHPTVTHPTVTHPTISAIVPRGGQRGTEIKLTIYGARLSSIEGLLLVREGIEVLEVKKDRANRAYVTIRIAKDCPLGAHQILVRTDRGLSNLKLFMVGTRSELKEKEPNNDSKTAQKIALDVTVNGRITAEDLDVFAIDVKKGQRIKFEVVGLRLGDREFDVHMTIRDANGKKLAMVDDTIFGRMDPIANLTCQRDGTWFVSLRENARGGSNTSFYRFHVGTFPRPLVAFPAGGRPGTKLKTTLIGDGVPMPTHVQLPKRPGLHEHFVTTKRGTSPTPIHLVVSDKPNIMEGSLAKLPKGSSVSGWWMVGPFANRDKRGKDIGHRTAYPPEKKLDLKAEYAGRDGKIKWQTQSALRDNITHDLRRIVKKSDHSVVYLARTIQAETARRVLLLFSGDDTVKIWCNRKLVLDDKKASGVVASQHRLLLNIAKGRNELLVKISNRGGRLGFHCRYLDPLRQRGFGTFPIPAALNGIISKPNEQDRYAFLARKGEQIDFQAVSRRLRSPLDPVLATYCTHQRFYAGNDDTRGIGLDSLLRFRAPFTGEFVLTVRDMLLTAGPGHIYRIEVGRPAARTLTTRVSQPGYQYEWTVNVPKGGRDAVMIATTNLDQNAGVQLSFAGLPKGVKAHVPVFAKGVKSVPVVFEATADAPHSGNLIRIVATATKKKLDLSGVRHYQQVDIVQARNRRRYLTTEIERLPVAVCKKSPFTLELAPIKVPLCRNSPLQIPFAIKRVKGYKQSVRVRMLYNPPGISSNQITIAAGKTKGVLNLYANSGARIGIHKIVLVGMGSVLGAQVASSSSIRDLEVSAPWMTASIGTVRTDPGKEITLPITFRAPKKFSGKIEAQWVGLPRGVVCPTPNLLRETPKLALAVKIAANAPPGRHRGFRLRLKIQTAGGWVVQDFRSGEIRIDRPQPKKPAPKKPKKIVAKKTQPNGAGS